MILDEEAWRVRVIVEGHDDFRSDVVRGNGSIDHNDDLIEQVAVVEVLLDRRVGKRHEGGAFDKPVEGESSDELCFSKAKRRRDTVEIADDESVLFEA